MNSIPEEHDFSRAVDDTAIPVLHAAEKLTFLKGTAFRPYVTNLESVRLLAAEG